MKKVVQENTVPAEERIPYWVKAVAVFFLGWVALYATRTIMNPVMDNIQVEFGLTNAQLGLIMSVFFLAYAGLNVPSGVVGDKIGKKRVLVPGVILFGIFAAITGMMPTFLFFMLTWVMVGAFQGFYYGPQYGLSSEAIPQKRITLGSAIINSGMAFGTSLGYYISTYTVDVFGLNWRVPFFIIGALVVLIGIAMALVIKDRPKTKEEKAAENGGEKLKLGDLFKNKNLILAYITIFTAIYGFFVIITWLPYYLEHERGITGGSVAFVSSLVPWAAIPGSILFSWIADKMGKRKPVLLVMLPLSLLAIVSIVAFDSMAILYVALLGYGIFGKISTNPVLVAVVADNAPKHAYGTSFGVYNFIGMCGSILAPYITGYLTDVTGSMNTGFYFAAALLVIGTIAVLFMDESERPNVDESLIHEK
ncbi:MFS transporter [Virgibacillus halodenitrificans]|uniref:MFS transporter n=1 Tax=Virgibacillus halodenitrificans TaxID=1482 RepID=A0ABR7VS42_VIRHA|nr:MFS transporter [Virgibacillus halodenitrificans]MBD1224576.1 MFS transporter [Virgibacillus halodenitrificans]MCJ0932880.1 MFS transporter [Virgibacillus halodenitrificans]MYL44726.1 MFS transporter [Virgibacillus halodenitrificans]MYL56921.1 MFS transporter [Virgibacillus halodenitrificans]WHX26702.1 MFS transporter [Virgibacillus halodenitrificans]